MKPKEISSKTVFTSPYFTVEEKMLLYPNGYEHKYYVEHGNDFVVVVCEKDGKFLMVNQYRVPLGGISLEFPAGGIKDGEEKEVAAKRELLEETGYKVKELVLLGSIRPLIARSDTKGFLFYTKLENEYEQEEQKLDPSELGLKARWVDMDELELTMFECEDLDSITVWAIFMTVQKQARR